MIDAADYLTRMQAIIVANPKVIRCSVIREEAQGDTGLFRYRLSLCDGSTLEMFELFQIKDKIQVCKYSFHWQDPDGRLRKRWDNAPHHPEISTNPNHVHYGEESNVGPAEPLNAEEALFIISAEITNTRGGQY